MACCTIVDGAESFKILFFLPAEYKHGHCETSWRLGEGSECWSDKLGHISVSVSLFLEQLPPVMSDTNYFLLQIGSVCTSHPGVMSVSCTSLCFLSSGLAPFFSVTCCSQLSILPVFWSISCQGRDVLLLQTRERGNPLMASRHRAEVRLPVNLLWRRATFCRVILREINIKLAIYHTFREGRGLFLGC